MQNSSEGFQQCYNAQLAVDDAHQLVVAAEVTANASDQGQLLPRLDEVEAAYGAVPERVLADAGYCNERDLSALEERGVDGYVALGREGKKAAADAKSRPGGGADGEEAVEAGGPCPICPSQVAFGGGPTAGSSRRWAFGGSACAACEKVQGEWALVCLALNMKRMQGLQAA